MMLNMMDANEINDIEKATGVAADKSNNGRKPYLVRRPAIIAVVVVSIIAISIGIVVVIRNNGEDRNGKSSSNLSDGETTPTPTPLPPEPPVGPVNFVGVGCFENESSLDTHLLSHSGANNRAKECSDRCFTRFFGVTGDICSCFVDVPINRLSIGSCQSAKNTSVGEEDRMELYFNQAMSTTCSQERTETVRNFLVEEDDAPFGFDIVDNTFRASPFELFKDECGTNIYEVQTEVSEGSQSLQTTVSEVTSFANSRRTERVASLSTSASVSYKSFLYSASAKVSASADTEQTNLFKSSGAGEKDAKLFSSIGVKRLAEVKIVDFDNTYKFVTLSRPFGNLLRDYLESGFEKQKAYEIIEKYGQFVLTRGIFGGFMQLRSTVANTDIADSFSSEEGARACYEASVSVEASGFGFKGKASVDASTCSAEQKTKFQSSRERFGEEVSEETVVGGRKVNSNDFVVEAQDSTLLTTKDKYPPNDEGVQFRLLSDFLSPDKISPLEVRRLQITEAQFGFIQTNLQQHILDFFGEVGDAIGDCNCALPYFDEDPETGKRVCRCYGSSGTRNVRVYVSKIACVQENDGAGIELELYGSMWSSLQETDTGRTNHWSASSGSTFDIAEGRERSVKVIDEVYPNLLVETDEIYFGGKLWEGDVFSDDFLGNEKTSVSISDIESEGGTATRSLRFSWAGDIVDVYWSFEFVDSNN